MATPTPRMGLTRDDGTDNYSVSRVNSNNDKIDEYIGFTPCTSSLRPSSGLFNGRVAYETDTDASIVYLTGAANWRYVTAPKVASAAARDALSPKFDGMECYRKDIDMMEIWNGSAWRKAVQGKRLLKAKELGSNITGIGPGENFSNKFDLTPVNVIGGVRYLFTFESYVNAALGSYTFRIYKHTQVQPLATTVLRCTEGGFDTRWGFQVTWPCTADETGLMFYITFERTAGSGTLGMFGGLDRRSFFSVEEEIDTSGNWSVSA